MKGTRASFVFENRLPIEEPELLVAPANWTGHVPFAFWLVHELRPRTIVELGVHTGTSYCAFCQEVRRSGLATACFGIDTWKGDDHAGHYGDEVLEALRQHHDPRYASFSRLVRSTFDDAVRYFADGSVDLFHIDGFHSYAGVRHDFETWLPKLSDHGVVLFHDINVRENEFGVSRLWDELRTGRPHFSFLHSHGLGVLAAGSVVPDGLRTLFEADEAACAAIRTAFARLGRPLAEVVELRSKLAARAAAQTALQTEAEALRRDLGVQREALMASQGEAEALRRDLGVQREALMASQGEAEALRREMDAHAAACTAAQHTVHALMQSTSWRITAPLRRVVVAVRQAVRPIAARLRSVRGTSPSDEDGGAPGGRGTSRAAP